MNKWIMGLIMALCGSQAFAADDPAVGTHHLLKQGTLEREYYLFKPAKAGKEPRPLVVVLHGGFGNPKQVANTTGFSALAARENFYVAYPVGTGRIPTWNAGECCGYAERSQIDDAGFIRQMIAEIAKDNAIDDMRIYATGMSNGGMMAYRLACEMGDVFAAIAPVAGAHVYKECKPNGRTSVVIFHAMDDEHVLYDGGVPTKGARASGGRKPEPDPSVPDSMSFWLKHNYCRNFPASETHEDYNMQNFYCAEGREVRLYATKTGGHSWAGGKAGRLMGDTPTQSISATEEIWKFFKAHPPRELF